MTEHLPIAPDAISAFLDEEATKLLADYFNTDRFTGGRFERFAGGGDLPAVADRFTSDDIVAVAMLGVRIPGRPALAILESRADEFSDLLAQVPSGVDLWLAEESHVEPGSPVDRLWSELVGLEGVNWVTAGKLIARKRPRLIPVYDRVVKAALNRDRSDSWWVPLRSVLVDHPEIIDRLIELRSESAIGQDIALLRVLDVAIWMREHGQPLEVPNADS